MTKHSAEHLKGYIYQMSDHSKTLEDPFAPFRLVTFHLLAYNSPKICRLRNGSKSQPRVMASAEVTAGGKSTKTLWLYRLKIVDGQKETCVDPAANVFRTIEINRSPIQA